MFSSGALYGAQLFLQDDFPMSPVCCPLAKPGVTLGRWRTTHISSQPCHLEGCVRLFSAHSRHCFLSEAGHRRPKRLFRSLYRRLAGAEHHRWETYQEHRVQARGHIFVHYDTCPGVCLNLTDLTICHVVSQCSTFAAVSVTLQIFRCCKNVGREACWLVSSLSFLPLDSPDFLSFLTPRVTIYRSEGAHCRNTCRLGCSCVVGQCSWFGCWLVMLNILLFFGVCSAFAGPSHYF